MEDFEWLDPLKMLPVNINFHIEDCLISIINSRLQQPTAINLSQSIPYLWFNHRAKSKICPKEGKKTGGVLR